MTARSEQEKETDRRGVVDTPRRGAVICPTERGWIDWNRAVVDAAEADPKRLPVIAATLATVVAEDSSRVSGTARPTARRYLDTIETWGYQPTEAEQAQRLAAANQQPAD